MYYLAEAFPFIKRWRLPLARDQFMLLLAAVNELFLGFDIYLAHNINGTIRTPYEWIPIFFGPIAGVLLLVAGWISFRNRKTASLIGTIVFFSNIVVGLLGTYFHFNRTLLLSIPLDLQTSPGILVFAPPLLGPLTFILVAVIGLSAVWIEDPLDSGHLTLLGSVKVNMPTSKTQAYFFLTGLFILATVLSSVLDHARTHFANPWLWLPTFVGIFAIAVTLAMGVVRKIEKGDLIIFVVAMISLVVVGLTGVGLHTLRNLNGQGELIGERFLRGAPMLAPLLFANMGLLGLIVLLDPKER